MPQKKLKMISKKKRGLRYWFNLLVIPSILGFIVYLQLTIYLLTKPAPSSLCCTTPLESGFPYEDVTLVAPDGAKLSGWYIPSQNSAAVILLHGYGGDRVHMMNPAKVLAEQGFGVLMYDARASGKSGGKRRSFGWQDVDDVQAAINFLQNRDDIDPDRIGILGFSTGAEIALNAAAKYAAIKATLADGAGFPSTGDIPAPVNLRERITHPSFALLFKVMEWELGIEQPGPISQVIHTISPRAVFLVSTGNDLELRQNTIYYEQASEPKEHWNVPETGHGGAFRARPEEYSEKIKDFFTRWLLSS